MDKITELIENNRYADLMQAGLNAECRVEEAIEDHLGFYVGIGWDHYDNSLEIHMPEDIADDWQATEKEWELIKSFGFSRAWFNFKNGTEQHVAYQMRLQDDTVQAPYIGERGARNHPHWRDKSVCSSCGKKHYKLLADNRDLKAKLDEVMKVKEVKQL